MLCGSCATLVQPGAFFCAICGAPVREAPTRGTIGERRQITAMFCDLVESTRLAQRLDPEDLHQVILRFQALGTESVERLGGRVAQYLGDGLLVYFGQPRAHEDDAARALRAALAILEAMPRLNAELAALLVEPLSVRVGIHTGLVVVGRVGVRDHPETLALGDTVNIASRLQAVAEPDQVVLSSATQRLVGREFVLAELGKKTLRGVAEPVSVYRLIGLRDTTPAAFAPTPHVGRDREMERLVAGLEQARGGQGAVVLVQGEAGIGKSRLVRSFREEATAHGTAWLEWRCSRYHQATAFHPVLVAFKQALGFAEDETPAAHLARLEETLAAQGLAAGQSRSLVADLLGLEAPADWIEPPESPEARRRRTLDLFFNWARGPGSEPRILAVEDLHWADPSTLELLGRLVEAVEETPLLLLSTFRPQFVPPWRGPAVHLLELRPLTRWQVTTLVDAIVGGSEFSPALRAEVVARTDGIPLFVEELTRALLERSGTSGTGPREVPSTLRGSLMARLDNLGPARELAQQAAVLGREFSLDLLRAVTDDAEALARRFPVLLESGLVGPDEGEPPGYAFKHALVQEIAYESQLREQRRATHARVVHALEERFPERARAEPELVARHCEEAGLLEPAARYFLRAGEQAIKRSAHTEALGQLRRGLALVERLHDPGSARLELALLVALGTPVLALRGWGHPEIESTQTRALALSREVGEGPELYHALAALYMFYGPRAEFDTATAVAEQLIEIGHRSGEGFLEMAGEGFLGLLLFYRGRFPEAWQRCCRMLDLEAADGEIPDWYGGDTEPGVLMRSCGSMTLALLGRVDEAARMAREAVAHGRRSRNPFNHGVALGFAGLALHTCGDAEGVLACGEEGIEVCSKQGFPTLIGLATALHGWATAELEDAPRGVAEIQRGLKQGSEAGARVEGPRVLGLLAEAHRRAGDLDAARGATTAALHVAERHGNAFWNAELERLLAELAFEQAPAASEARAEAKAGLERALALAREQGSPLLAERVLASMRRYRIASV